MTKELYLNIIEAVLPGSNILQTESAYSRDLFCGCLLKLENEKKKVMQVVVIENTSIFPVTIDDVVMELTDGGDVAYWLDENGKHHNNSSSAMIALNEKCWYVGVV